MDIELVSHPAPALWQYRMRDDDANSHDVVIYGVPSVFPRGPYYQPDGVEEGPTPQRRLLLGDASWYEATVDGGWADASGHAGYATHTDALAAALEGASLPR
jgi:hypothetical protein